MVTTSWAGRNQAADERGRVHNVRLDSPKLRPKAKLRPCDLMRRAPRSRKKRCPTFEQARRRDGSHVNAERAAEYRRHVSRVDADAGLDTTRMGHVPDHPHRRGGIVVCRDGLFLAAFAQGHDLRWEHTSRYGLHSNERPGRGRRGPANPNYLPRVRRTIGESPHIAAGHSLSRVAFSESDADSSDSSSARNAGFPNPAPSRRGAIMAAVEGIPFDLARLEVIRRWIKWQIARAAAQESPALPRSYAPGAWRRRPRRWLCARG